MSAGLCVSERGTGRYKRGLEGGGEGEGEKAGRVQEAKPFLVSQSTHLAGLRLAELWSEQRKLGGQHIPQCCVLRFLGCCMQSVWPLQ